MKASVAGILVSIGICGFALAQSQDAGRTLPQVPTAVMGEPLSIHLKAANINAAVSALQSTLKIPICFETESLDPKTQGITAKEHLASLKSRRAPQAEIQEMAKTANAHPHTIVTWKMPRFDIDVTETVATELIAKVLKPFAGYDYRFEGAYLLIFPKNSVLSGPADPMRASDLTLGEALQRIDPLLKKEKISPLQFPTGNTPWDPLALPIANIDLGPGSLQLCLTRLCQATNPPTIWWLGGMKGGRMLSFGPAPAAPSF